MRKVKAWPYKIGNPVLSKVWEKNTTTLVGFEVEPADDFDLIVRDWRMTKKVIVQRTAQLAASTAAKDGKEISFSNQLEQVRSVPILLCSLPGILTTDYGD